MHLEFSNLYPLLIWSAVNTLKRPMYTYYRVVLSSPAPSKSKLTSAYNLISIFSTAENLWDWVDCMFWVVWMEWHLSHIYSMSRIRAVFQNFWWGCNELHQVCHILQPGRKFYWLLITVNYAETMFCASFPAYHVYISSSTLLPLLDEWYRCG